MDASRGNTLLVTEIFILVPWESHIFIFATKPIHGCLVSRVERYCTMCSAINSIFWISSVLLRLSYPQIFFISLVCTTFFKFIFQLSLNARLWNFGGGAIPFFFFQFFSFNLLIFFLQFKPDGPSAKRNSGELLLTSNNVRSLQDLHHFFSSLSRATCNMHIPINNTQLETVIEQDFLEKMPTVPAR